MHLQVQLQMAPGHRCPDVCPKGQTLPSVTLALDRRHQLKSAPGMTEHRETWREDEHRAWATGSALHFRCYLDTQACSRSTPSMSHSSQTNDHVQEHLEAGLVFHNSTSSWKRAFAVWIWRWNILQLQSLATASYCSIILCSLQKQLVFITPVLRHGRGGPGTNHHLGSKVTTILSYLCEKLALAPSLAHLYMRCCRTGLFQIKIQERRSSYAVQALLLVAEGG